MGVAVTEKLGCDYDELYTWLQGQRFAAANHRLHVVQAEIQNARLLERRVDGQTILERAGAGGFSGFVAILAAED